MAFCLPKNTLFFEFCRVVWGYLFWMVLVAINVLKYLQGEKSNQVFYCFNAALFLLILPGSSQVYLNCYQQLGQKFLQNKTTFNIHRFVWEATKNLHEMRDCVWSIRAEICFPCQWPVLFLPNAILHLSAKKKAG